MRQKPLKRYSPPIYPIKAWVDAHPEWLERIPQRWHLNPVILTLLTGALLIQPGIQGKAAKRPKNFAAVAPIFQHGKGRGSIGGLADTVSFISEEEAYRIITEEATKFGVHFTHDRKVLGAVDLPVTSFKSDGSIVETSFKSSLELDGTDEKLNISYEFISEEDVQAWQSGSKHYPASIFDMQTKALKLREGLMKTKAEGAYGIFYDPLGGRSKAGAEEAREELRQQVRDFIEWLKVQGVL